jgi:hypothetical protein
MPRIAVAQSEVNTGRIVAAIARRSTIDGILDVQ